MCAALPRASSSAPAGQLRHVPPEVATALDGESLCYHLAVLDEAFWRSHKLESGYSDCNHNIRCVVKALHLMEALENNSTKRNTIPRTQGLRPILIHPRVWWGFTLRWLVAAWAAARRAGGSSGCDASSHILTHTHARTHTHTHTHTHARTHTPTHTHTHTHTYVYICIYTHI